MLKEGALGAAAWLSRMPGGGRKWAGTMGGKAAAAMFGGAATGLRGFASLKPFARRGVVGGLAGAGYGAFSDDTSVLGGAFMGAGIGMAAGPAGRGLSRGLWGYRGARAMGMGVGQSAAASARIMGRASRKYFGSAFNQAYNPIRGLWNESTWMF